MLVGMEHAFDDIAAALRGAQASVWPRFRAFALDLAEKLFLGVAIGIGFAIVHAFVG